MGFAAPTEWLRLPFECGGWLSFSLTLSLSLSLSLSPSLFFLISFSSLTSLSLSLTLFLISFSSLTSLAFSLSLFSLSSPPSPSPSFLFLFPLWESSAFVSFSHFVQPHTHRSPHHRTCTHARHPRECHFPPPPPTLPFPVMVLCFFSLYFFNYSVVISPFFFFLFFFFFFSFFLCFLCPATIINVFVPRLLCGCGRMEISGSEWRRCGPWPSWSKDVGKKE